MWSHLRLLGLGVSAVIAGGLGCSFDTSGKATGSSTSEEPTTTTGTDSTETGDSSTTDPSTTDPSTTDPSTTGPVEDVGTEFCSLDVRPPLEILVDQAFNPCPAEVGAFVLISPGNDGALAGILCQGTCDDCNDVNNFEIRADPIDINLFYKPTMSSCLFLEAEGLLDEQLGQCSYSAVSLNSGGLQDGELAFMATRDGWGSTSAGMFYLDLWQPNFMADESCACEDTGPRFECCDDEATIYDFGLPGDQILAPGESTMISISGVEYLFYGQQAQTGVGCEVENEVSWFVVGQ